MKPFLLFLSLFSFLNPLFEFTCQAASPAKPEQIVIGFIPSENADKLKKNAVALARQIQKRIGIQTNVLISKDYQGLIDAMKEKKIDFAFFTAMSFVFAEKQADAKVLLQKVWAQPFYYSLIVTSKKKGIRKLEDLKGKKFAFVDEKSTSGFLYPSVAFQEKKMDPKRDFKEVLFKGNHEAAVKAVLSGEADAAAIFSDDREGKKSAWAQFAKDHMNDLQVLWVSDPIPNDPFSVRKDFYDQYPTVSYDLMFALTEMQENPEGRETLKNLLGVIEMRLATSGLYEPVRKMVKTLNLRLK